MQQLAQVIYILGLYTRQDFPNPITFVFLNCTLKGIILSEEAYLGTISSSHIL